MIYQDTTQYSRRLSENEPPNEPCDNKGTTTYSAAMATCKINTNTRRSGNKRFSRLTFEHIPFELMHFTGTLNSWAASGNENPAISTRTHTHTHTLQLAAHYEWNLKKASTAAHRAAKHSNHNAVTTAILPAARSTAIPCSRMRICLCHTFAIHHRPHFEWLHIYHDSIAVAASEHVSTAAKYPSTSLQQTPTP
jgi:hypothetical protein